MIIALEGTDQAGKKTQTAMLAKALKAQKIKTAVFEFPDYSTVIGKEINSYLHGKRKFPPEIIHYLYAANRWEKLEEIKKSAAKNSLDLSSTSLKNSLATCFTSPIFLIRFFTL